ncbi:NADH dehydrogenase subunit 5 [Ureibacillus sp. FSL E2-3493]|uniref:NADH dehydrogenase subunit 5 n=1 Tax=Ureibacillus sp. FSL E2-3493 TaxID=2921367 RepID=UPI003119A04F
MFFSLDASLFPIVFLIVLAIAALSSIIFLNPNTPLSFIRIHIGLIALPPIIALMALISNDGGIIMGPLHFDSLSWLLAFFVLTISLIIQRYCIHYLNGDKAYRKYFTLLTLTTIADSVAWLSNDLRLLLVCWGATLFGLTLLIGLKKEWQVARNAAKICGCLFALSWGLLTLAIVWLTEVTNHWQLTDVLTASSMAQLDSWEQTSISLLFVVAVVIPAAQWPFQRWLLDSVVAPTPISAVMHAGIVNAGGIILTLFAPLFAGSSVQILLFAFSSISVLIGTGIMLVQVDYKRQLVGSTIAQMGFMLIQCALGAYVAAIIHAVLHGLFKSTLFLQAGSVLDHSQSTVYTKKTLPFKWIFTGSILALLVGIGYWLTSPEEGYQLVSAFMLGWSVFLAWVQLVAFGLGKVGRIFGLFVFVGGGIIYFYIHHLLHNALYETMPKVQTSTIGAILIIFILLLVSIIGLWLTRNRLSKLYTMIYLWLVRLGEPHEEGIESHPSYLKQILSQGGK